jgi:hypothetical protein
VTKRPINPAILLAAVLIIFALVPAPAFAQDDAAAAIASARQQLANCYDSVRQAESAGANISSLTWVLNGAGQLLSKSELAYSQGDSAAAQSLASQVGQKLGSFVSDANALRDSTIQQQSFDFWENIVGSVAGTIAVIVAGFVVWRFLKKRYVTAEVKTEAQPDGPSGD